MITVRSFWEEFFVYIEIDFVKILDFVKIFPNGEEEEEEGQEFRSLEVQHKLIALKDISNSKLELGIEVVIRSFF
jgi:hypothetical protein